MDAVINLGQHRYIDIFISLCARVVAQSIVRLTLSMHWYSDSCRVISSLCHVRIILSQVEAVADNKLVWHFIGQDVIPMSNA